MWWIVLGVVAVWLVVAVIVGVRMGKVITTADIEDGAAEVRREIRGRRPADE
ncbi:hypothetical protein R4172_05625 [Rhodococcus kroppenstedtii]|uniref:hypothetical protein n=1 Tax=Rhodococcoides kroppenstedtii TaxID=293050 RepID=UPI002955B86F|nr:hypothetical protein [Rhodococcus kroppenstedtii]MDV7197037.1 hypothetical protein [Rhodococcus kroppenstedtii]